MITKSEDRLLVRKIFQEIPFFSNLKVRELDVILEYLQKKSFSSGSVIFNEGDCAHSFYLIADGRVSVCKKKWRWFGKKREKIVELGVGQYFGEMALISEKQRYATVIAKTRLITYKLTKYDLMKIMKCSSEIRKGIVTEAKRRKLINLKREGNT